jgi:hypothetical protein
MDTSNIQEHMEVVGSDGQHVGTVDHMDGDSQIKLARKDPSAGGEHHWISTDDVDRVDDKVYLRMPASEARLNSTAKMI